MKRLLVVVAAGAVLAWPGVGLAKPLRAVGICGPDRCNVSNQPALLAELATIIEAPPSARPTPEPARFYVVDMMTASGTDGNAAFLPTQSLLWWHPPGGAAHWLALSPRAAAFMRAGGRGAAPYDADQLREAGPEYAGLFAGGSSGSGSLLFVVPALVLVAAAAAAVVIRRRVRARR